MAYVPGFEHDIFISYAHIDNEPFGERQSCWVSDFHRNLQTRVAQLLGNAATIWRDPRLQGNEVLWETLGARLQGAAVLLCVLSPRYIESESCLQELEFFYRHCQEDGSFSLGTLKRVFKVLKTPVELEKHPEPLRDLLGYEFHRVDPITGREREFHLDESAEAQRLYWAKLDDLAHEMKDLLAQMCRQRTGKGELRQTSPETSVYLAETTHDLREERAQLLRELKDRRHRVFPQKHLPEYAEEFERAVRSDLKECKLSIHMVGANYGVIPEGETRSVVALQHELAAERGKQGGFSELIWIRPNLQPREDRQKEFVTQLETYSASGNGFELLKTTLVDLKTCIQDKLGGPASPPRPQREDGPVRLYLICDQQDLEAIRPLRRYLFEKGCEITLPLWKGNVTELRQDHEENLRLCEAAIIYYGQADEAWFREKLRDLWKSPGLGRSKPALIGLIYMGPPQNSEKEEFQSRQYQVVQNFATFSPESLSPFMTQLERRKGAAS